MIICTAGHRPDKLGGYSEATSVKTLNVARQAIVELKPTKVISGMALGWDTALAVAALEASIPLIAAVPHRGFDGKWFPTSQKLYKEILEIAEEVVYVDELEGKAALPYQVANRFMKPRVYSPIKMQTRNMYMVDKSDVVAALWDGSTGGTFNCLKYAEKVGRPVSNYWAHFKP